PRVLATLPLRDALPILSRDGTPRIDLGPGAAVPGRDDAGHRGRGLTGDGFTAGAHPHGSRRLRGRICLGGRAGAAGRDTLPWRGFGRCRLLGSGALARDLFALLLLRLREQILGPI